jgi:hypothetical protein
VPNATSVTFTANGGLRSAGSLLGMVVVQSASATGIAVSSQAATYASAQLSGDTNVVGVSCSIAGDISSVTDTSGNTYTLISSQTNGLYNLYVYACVAVVAAGAGTNVVTVAFTASVTSSVQIAEVSGVQGVDANVVVATGTTTGSTATLNSQYVQGLVFCFAVGNSTTAPTAGAGFTTQTSGTATALAYIMETAQQTTMTAVTCAATGVGASVAGAWTTVAIALYPVVAPPALFPLTVCFFFQYTAAGVYKLIQFDGGNLNSNFNGWYVSVNDTANKLGYNSGNSIVQTVSPTLAQSTWYFVAVSILNASTTGVVCYIKPVGAPVCTRTVPTNDQSESGACTGVYVGVFNNASVANTLPTGGEALVGSMAGIRVWTTILTQAEIEKESQQIEPFHLPGLWCSLPLTTGASWTDDTASGLQQFAPYSTGGTVTLTTASGPNGILRAVQHRILKRSAQKLFDVLFFNGPF